MADTPEDAQEPFRRKLSIGLDISGQLLQLLEPEIFSQAISVDFELRPHIMAAFETGISRVRVSNDLSQYSASGQFFRIGANYNLLQQQPHLQSDQIFALIRYSFGFNSHEAPIIHMENPYWGPFTHSFERLYFGSHWAEVGLGLRTRLFDNFFVGWNIRASFLLAQTGNLQAKPYYFSGFGKNTGNTKFGFQYFIIYRLPTKN